jgi:hypothetical protein
LAVRFDGLVDGFTPALVNMLQSFMDARKRDGIEQGYTLPTHEVFHAYMEEIRTYLGSDWTPLRIAKDGCGLPTVSNTVAELAQIYAGLVRDKDKDWIWEAMVRHPDLVGGFNRLDSTVLKAGEGKVIAKEGADGLLGLAIEHPDYPKGLGIVVKIAHGWNSQATWYVARAVLGVLGINLRNPYPLHRQKAFIVPGIVPPKYLEVLETLPTGMNGTQTRTVGSTMWRCNHEDTHELHRWEVRTCTVR